MHDSHGSEVSGGTTDPSSKPPTTVSGRRPTPLRRRRDRVAALGARGVLASLTAACCIVAIGACTQARAPESSQERHADTLTGASTYRDAVRDIIRAAADEPDPAIDELALRIAPRASYRLLDAELRTLAVEASGTVTAREREIAAAVRSRLAMIRDAGMQDAARFVNTHVRRGSSRPLCIALFAFPNEIAMAEAAKGLGRLADRSARPWLVLALASASTVVSGGLESQLARQELRDAIVEALGATGVDTSAYDGSTESGWQLAESLRFAPSD